MTSKSLISASLCLGLALAAYCAEVSVPAVAAFYRPSQHVGLPAGKPAGAHAPFKPLPGYLDSTNPTDVATEIAVASNAGIDMFLWGVSDAADDFGWRALTNGFLKAANRSQMKVALSVPALSSEAFGRLLEKADACCFGRPEYARDGAKPLVFVRGAAVLPSAWADKVAVRGPDAPGVCGVDASADVETFGRALRAARTKGARLIAIDAWNDCARGRWLLPNIRESDQMLRCVANVFGRRPADRIFYCPMKHWWDKNAKNQQAASVTAPTFENVKYGPHLRQGMDVWLPTDTAGRAPCVILIHGGAWMDGDRLQEGTDDMVRRCRARGCAFVSITYRMVPDGNAAGVSPPVKVCLDDAVAAIRFVQEKSDAWNLDPRRIGLTGGSAGACSSLYASLQGDNALGIKAVFPQSPQTSLDPKETREWIPNAYYGAHAFGYANFNDWLAHRDECLPLIERYSPTALLRRCTPARAPMFFLNHRDLPPDGQLPKDPTHAGMFGFKFTEECARRGVFGVRGKLDDFLDALCATGGAGSDAPPGYVPAMLSNGRVCMTADFLGGVPASPAKTRGSFLTPGIFIEGRRLGPPKYDLYGHGHYRLTLAVDGKPCAAPNRWTQNLDALGARSIVTNFFGPVTRVVETFVAADADVIAVRQTFPGTDAARLAVGLDYVEPRDERIVGTWETLPDGRAFTYVAYGRNVDRGRITLRHAREDGAFVTFISFGEPYAGTYAALAGRHAAAWAAYYGASRVEVPDAALMRMRLMAEYQMKCNVTDWTIPVGIFPSHWSGKSFAFDEMYGVQGLLSAGHFAEARRAADFRFKTLPQAQQRVKHRTKKFFGYGARWLWEGMEDNVTEGSPLGYWYDHIFHMSAIARTCHLTAAYMDDLAYLREKAYPVMRDCARFFRSQHVYESADGSAFIGKCTDLERLGPGRDRPFMTTCGVIHTFRSCAEAAGRLGVDAEEAADWRATADRLEKSLPVKDGRFAATADDLDALSMGTLAGYFPFPIFPQGHPRQTAAVDYFLAQGAKGGNMYPTGKKICPWYAATMAMAALRAGEGERVLPLLKEAAKSAGAWGEYWEINEPGVAEYRPWFMTAAGNCLYALNQMLLTEADGECRLAAGVPAAWKDYAFRLPAEGGYEVDCAVKNGKLARLALRTRHPGTDRKVTLVLPDGTRRALTLDKPEVAVEGR
ncbi:MAG: alpha/beta hydrolase [Kiritimatiellae bacterium]|nr:alpha/beta hydrolase [Kiritimatiellia bacterium]